MVKVGIAIASFAWALVISGVALFLTPYTSRNYHAYEHNIKENGEKFGGTEKNEYLCIRFAHYAVKSAFLS